MTSVEEPSYVHPFLRIRIASYYRTDRPLALHDQQGMCPFRKDIKRAANVLASSAVAKKSCVIKSPPGSPDKCHMILKDLNSFHFPQAEPYVTWLLLDARSIKRDRRPRVSHNNGCRTYTIGEELFRNDDVLNLRIYSPERIYCTIPHICDS